MKTTPKKAPRAAAAQPTPVTAPSPMKPPAESKLMQLELDVLELGPNYRRKLEPAKDTELRNSLFQHGVLQPVLVRPWKVDHETGVVMSYQVVAGSRRVRLAREVGLTSAPALVRAMTDAEALELQLTENIQRADADPLDEAEAFARLRDECGYSLEDLRLRSGKSMTWVRERLALSGLCPSGRALYDSGAISASHALELAKLGSAQAQEDAIKTLERDWRSRYGLAGMSVAELRVELATRCFRNLENATWSLGDANLLPAAGACSACPKRTGGSPELFAELSSGNDCCTDSVCWSAKLDAVRQLTLEELKRQGYQVLDGALAKKAVDKHGYAKEGFARVDQPINSSGRSVEEACGDFIPPEARGIVLLPDGEPVQVVTSAVLDAAAKKARVKLPAVPKASGSRAGLPGSDWKEEERARKERDALASSQHPFVMTAAIDYFVDAIKSLEGQGFRELDAAAEVRFSACLTDQFEGERRWDWHGMPGVQDLCAAACALRLVDRAPLQLEHPHVGPQGAEKARRAALKWLSEYVKTAELGVRVWWIAQAGGSIISASAPWNHLNKGGKGIFPTLRTPKINPTLFELEKLSGLALLPYVERAEQAWTDSQVKAAEPAKKAAAKKKGGRK